jgi:alkylation response protein AidB-like acyl-CoA dehydrogenase
LSNEDSERTMASRTAQPVPTGFLRSPATPAGRALLDLLEGHLPRIAETAQDNDRTGTFPAETFAAFGKDGILGATAPAELGGLGVDRLHDVALALATVAAADASTALALHVQFSRGLTLTYDWQHGSTPACRALARRLLRGMGGGTSLICGTVKDHHSAVTTLTPDEAGGWVLNGRKTLVTMATVATDFVVHALWRRADGSTVLTTPVVSRNTPGVTVLDNGNGMGMCASGTVDVIFENCPVPDEDVIVRGLAGEGTDATLAGQTVSSITMLGIYTGIAASARDLAVGKFATGAEPPAAVRTLIAAIETNLFTLRATVAAALAEADAHSADLTGDPAARGRAMMLPFQCAKATVNELGLKIVNDSLTAVGGVSYSASHPLSRLYRDIRAGAFMQPYTYIDAVDFLSAQALGLRRDNDYISVRATRSTAAGGDGRTP